MIAAIVLAACVVRPSGSLYDAMDGRTSDSQNAGRRPMSAGRLCIQLTLDHNLVADVRAGVGLLAVHEAVALGQRHGDAEPAATAVSTPRCEHVTDAALPVRARSSPRGLLAVAPWRGRAGLPGPEPRARPANVTCGWWRSDARTSELEYNAVEVHPPDDCLDRPGTPMRREEIEAPFRALLEGLCEADFCREAQERLRHEAAETLRALEGRASKADSI
jgi:hypothetical protein